LLGQKLPVTVEHSPNVNGQAFTFRHLVDCVTFGADFGRLQPAKKQCGCHGSKRRHSDLSPPSRSTNREASFYTTVSYGHRQGNRRGCPRAAILPSCLTQNCECVAKEDRMCTASSCAKECTRDFTIGNWYEPSLKTLKLNCRGSYTFFKARRLSEACLAFLHQACVHSCSSSVEKAWPRPIA
jgi:hypothetical protein